MGKWKRAALASAAVVCTLLLSGTMRAQQQQQQQEQQEQQFPLPARCQSQPKGQTAGGQPAGQTAGTQLAIDNLQLEGASPPGSLNHEELVQTLEGMVQSGETGWLNRVWDAARKLWRDYGYFQTVVSVHALSDRLEGTTRHVSLEIHVDPGPQYRLAKVTMLNVNPGGKLLFANQKLRDLIPMRPGELVSVTRAQVGALAIRRLYASKGYVNVQVTPNFQIDNQKDLITLYVMLDQGKQYRFGEITVLGLQTSDADLVKSKLKSGDVFDPAALRQFYREHSWLLPPRASIADDEVRRNEDTGTIDLIVDFRACPKKPTYPGDKNGFYNP